MFFNTDFETVYRFSGMIWNELLIRNESSRSINWEQKSKPADVSTSCVIIVQLGAPSGQNQIKGTLVKPLDFIESARRYSKMLSTDVSTGHCGKGIFSQPRK